MRLGVFGGSFDPIHHAHVIVGHLAREQLALDRVHYVVAGNQPLKPAHGASAEDRLRMVELALADEVFLIADGREVARAGASYTVDTLHELTREHPGCELVLLLGADAAAGLPRWRDVAGIRRLARIAVFRRGEQLAPAGFDQTVNIPQLELSSTAIRARAARGMPLGGWVPQPVADYISGLRLYRTQGEVE